MQRKIILSQEPFDRTELIQLISNSAKRFGMRVDLEDVENIHHIEIYQAWEDKCIKFAGFRILSNEEFLENPVDIDGTQYHISSSINHNSEFLSGLNTITEEIMQTYPNLYIADEPLKEFYSYEDRQKGNVPEWLKV